MRKYAFAAAALAAFVSQAAAADLPSRKDEPVLAPVAQDSWVVGVTFYGWATSLDGRMRTVPPLRAVNVYADFPDILKNLKGVFMGSLDARYGRFVIFTDLIWSKIAPGKNFAAAGYPGTVTIDSSMGFGLLTGGYRFFDTPTAKIDVLAGVRGIAMSNTLNLHLGPLTAAYGKSDEWADAVIGARFRYELSDKMFAHAVGFVGAGGSKYEWDLYGGLGYRFDQNWSGEFGYRALKVDYVNGDFLYDAIMYGPLVAVHYQF